MMYLNVAVVVLNYNGGRFLTDCLASVAASSFTDFDTFMVDNGSRDESVRIVKNGFPDVKIILNETNLGFAAAYDRVCRLLTHDYIVLLNNDTVVDAHWLQRLVEVAEGDPRVAACTSRVLLVEDPTIVDHAGGVFTLIGSGLEYGKWARDLVLCESDFAAPLTPTLSPKESGEREGLPGHHSTVLPRGGAEGRLKRLSSTPKNEFDKTPGCGRLPTEVGFGTGCSLLVRRKAYLEVGGFDPAYGFYHEDVDLGWKFRMFGYSVMYVPDSIVYHHVGGGSYQGIDESPSRTWYCQKNRLANMLKNLEPVNLLRGLAVSTAYDALRIGRFWIRNRRDLLAAVLRGYRDTWARRSDLMRQRRFVQRNRKVSDRDLKPFFPSLLSSTREYRRMLKAHGCRVASGGWTSESP